MININISVIIIIFSCSPYSLNLFVFSMPSGEKTIITIIIINYYYYYYYYYFSPAVHIIRDVVSWYHGYERCHHKEKGGNFPDITKPIEVLMETSVIPKLVEEGKADTIIDTLRTYSHLSCVDKEALVRGYYYVCVCVCVCVCFILFISNPLRPLSNLHRVFTTYFNLVCLHNLFFHSPIYIVPQSNLLAHPYRSLWHSLTLP